MTLTRPPADTPALCDSAGDNAIVHAHYFFGSCDWLITEYDPEQDEAFGWVCLGDPGNAEFGYISFAELEAVKVGPGFTVEFETDWQPRPLREAIDMILARHGVTR